MDKQSKAGLLGLGAAMLLAGCAGNAGSKTAAEAKMPHTPVPTKVGASEGYEGVSKPTLEAIYTERAEDKAKYGPEMERIMRDGLDQQRELQSGI